MEKDKQPEPVDGMPDDFMGRLINRMEPEDVAYVAILAGRLRAAQSSSDKSPLREIVATLDALEAKATPGPWGQQLFYKPGTGYEPCNYVVQGEHRRTVALCNVDNERAHANAALIVALRNYWPLLRSAVDARREDTETS